MPNFILWYLKKCFEEANSKNVYEDDFIQITKRHNSWPIYIKDTSELVDHFYNNNLTGLFKDDKVYVKSSYTSNVFDNPFTGKIKSSFLELLLVQCTHLNWVDIENEFYRQLKKILLDQSKKQLEDVRILNDSLKFIIKQLEVYLGRLDSPTLIDGYSRIFSSPIHKREICVKIILKKNEEPKGTLILNFNYTSTPESYMLKDNISNHQINYIHGKVNDEQNRFIFGFGDELDIDYSKLELQRNNEFFEYIKSFWYFKTSNYHNLVRFIEGEEFQVYILGHSCGLSDRTMLNMIFEHENCKSIKIFYHGTKEKNNYTNLTQEISRHFKDKALMRKRIVPFDKSEPMPQVELN